VRGYGEDTYLARTSECWGSSLTPTYAGYHQHDEAAYVSRVVGLQKTQCLKQCDNLTRLENRQVSHLFSRHNVLSTNEFGL